MLTTSRNEAFAEDEEIIESTKKNSTLDAKILSLIHI